ncbi:MAG: hypothetical protein ACE5J4_02230, partial [Candidatus Aenigmatarchaeota archaeon]
HIIHKGEPKRVIFIHEDNKPKIPKIPKEFQWLVHLKKLKDRGYILKFVYNNNGKEEEFNKLKYYQVDSKSQSFIPIRPKFVRVLQYKKGKGFVEVAQLSGRRNFLDPDVDTVMKIWDVAKRL